MMADTNTHDQTYEFEDMINFLSDRELDALTDGIVNEFLVLPESWSPFPFLTTLYCVGRGMQRLPTVIVCPKRGALRRMSVTNLDKDWLQKQHELIVRSGGNVDSPAFDRGGFSALVEANRAEELARLLVKPLAENLPDPPPEFGESETARRSRPRRCGHQRNPL